jgi:hypothetical protein
MYCDASTLHPSNRAARAWHCCWERQRCAAIRSVHTHALAAHLREVALEGAIQRLRGVAGEHSHELGVRQREGVALVHPVLPVASGHLLTAGTSEAWALLLPWGRALDVNVLALDGVAVVRLLRTGLGARLVHVPLAVCQVPLKHSWIRVLEPLRVCRLHSRRTESWAGGESSHSHAMVPPPATATRLCGCQCCAGC